MISKKRKGVLAISMIFSSVFVPAFLAAALSADPGQKKDEAQRLEMAAAIIQELVKMPEEDIPEVLLQKTHAIALFPGVVKAAWGIGGQYGRGAVLVRQKDGTWSLPCFIRLYGGSIGWQIGVQKSDIILIFRSAKGVDGIAEGKVTLGADVSVVAGPVGRRAEASTDLEMKAEIYSYSRSKGLFAGISLKGGSLRIDAKANESFYGDDVGADDILQGQLSAGPEEGEHLRKVIAAYTNTQPPRK